MIRKTILTVSRFQPLHVRQVNKVGRMHLCYSTYALPCSHHWEASGIGSDTPAMALLRSIPDGMERLRMMLSASKPQELEKVFNTLELKANTPNPFTPSMQMYSKESFSIKLGLCTCCSVPQGRVYFPFTPERYATRKSKAKQKV